MNEKKRIINMIVEKKISAEEGAKLIEALNNRNKTTSKPKKLCLRVIEDGGKKAKVNIAIPLNLAKLGVGLIPKSGKLGASIGNTDFDFSQINWKDIIDLAISGEEGELFYLEIEGDNNKTYIITISVE